MVSDGGPGGVGPDRSGARWGSEGLGLDENRGQIRVSGWNQTEVGLIWGQGQAIRRVGVR